MSGEENPSARASQQQPVYSRDMGRNDEPVMSLASCRACVCLPGCRGIIFYHSAIPPPIKLRRAKLMAFTLEEFSAEAHRILAADPGPDGRKKICELVSRASTDPESVAKYLPDDGPERKDLFDQDPELGFCILGHVNLRRQSEPAARSRPDLGDLRAGRGRDDHDGLAKVEPPTETEPGKVRYVRDYKLTPGAAYVYNEGDLHSSCRANRRRPSRHRIEGRNVEKIRQAIPTSASPGLAFRPSAPAPSLRSALRRAGGRAGIEKLVGLRLRGGRTGWRRALRAPAPAASNCRPRLARNSPRCASRRPRCAGRSASSFCIIDSIACAFCLTMVANCSNCGCCAAVMLSRFLMSPSCASTGLPAGSAWRCGAAGFCPGGDWACVGWERLPVCAVALVRGDAERQHQQRRRRLPAGMAGTSQAVERVWHWIGSFRL